MKIGPAPAGRAKHGPGNAERAGNRRREPTAASNCSTAPGQEDFGVLRSRAGWGRRWREVGGTLGTALPTTEPAVK